MGRHHARTYARIPHAHLVAVVDQDMERAATTADEYGCKAYASAEEMLSHHPGVRAVTVAVPTIFHQREAAPLLSRRVACLIEKPLAPTIAAARELADLASRNNTILQVGHTERFNPAVRAVTALELTPRYIEIQRVSPMSFRSLDVGVVMDLMIHDLDIVLALARSTIEKVDATGVPVLGKHEDVANARLVFKSGCVASITASRLALKTARRLRLFSEDAYVSLDYQARTGIVIRKTDNNVVLDEVRRQVEAGADLTNLNYTDLVTMDELTMDEDPDQQDPLTAQLTSFLAAVSGGGKVVVDGDAGYAAVEAAERVIAAIHAHKWEGIDEARV